MFAIKEIRDSVFLLTFDNNYDLAMHFVRYQENYECPNRKFRDQNFKLVDYMEWYSKEYGEGVFSYTTDWGGFNVPGYVFDRIFQDSIPDANKYDAFMSNLYTIIKSQTEGKFYVLGTVEGNDALLRHEVAHSLWYMDAYYAKEMEANIDCMSSSIRSLIGDTLIKMGYHATVLRDESQAYLSTGLADELKAALEDEVDTENLMEPFIKTYKKYTEKEKEDVV